MPVYRIAELNIRIDPVTPQTEKRIEPYRCDAEDYDFDASVTKEEIDKYMEKSKVPCLPYLAEDALVLTNISRAVLGGYDGCFFHSSCLEMDGEGYLFTALSGTGKSTHTRNWRMLFGERVIMINDDKPLIRQIGGTFYVCSTPWMGKSNIGCNRIAPIKAIYVLKRGEKNSAALTSPAKQMRALMEATLLPNDRDNMMKLLGLFDALFAQAKLVELYCNQDIESAQVAYDAVCGEN